MFTGLLKAATRADGRKTLRGVASSTTKDLHGDTMLETALADMERDANNNLTIFLNHSYNVPEDVAGSVTKATMRTRGVDGDGNPNWDLDFDEVLVNEKNPRAIAAWEGINDGAKLGFSIGAMIPEGGAVRNKKDGTYLISHVVLLETSIVGIPANPRSWIQNAVKSFEDLEKTIKAQAASNDTVMSLGAPTLTLGQNGTYRIEGQLDASVVPVKAVEPTILEGDTPEGICAAASEDQAVLCSNEPGHDGRHSWDPEDGPNGVAAAAANKPCPTCGKTDCTEHKKDVEPDVTDAKVQIITIDTDDGGSGSSSDSGSSTGASSDSDPGDEGVYDSGSDAVIASATDAITKGADSEVLVTHLQSVLAAFERTTAELVAERAKRIEAENATKAAEQDRDEAYRAAGQIVLQARDVIEKLADTPLGRKATIKQAGAQLSHLEGVYSAEAMKMLRSNTTP